MKPEEISDILFKESTAILAKYNVNAASAPTLTAPFSSRWYFISEQSLEPMKELLRKMPLSLYFEKESEIKKICLRATEDLRLLIKRDEDASV